MNDMEMNNNIIDTIKKINPYYYPKLYNSLNGWKFPEELKEYEPKNWEQMTIKEQHVNPVFRAAIDYLKAQVPHKEFLRYHHLVNLKVKGHLEFEEWYKNRNFL